MGILLSDRVENIMGKGEIACYEQFLHFLQCFQKQSVVNLSKGVSVEHRVNSACFTPSFSNTSNSLQMDNFLYFKNSL